MNAEQIKVAKATADTPCDCLNDCGDDPWLRDGRSKPCAALLRRRAAVLPRAVAVNRGSSKRTVIVSFASNLTDEQLRTMHERFGLSVEPTHG